MIPGSSLERSLQSFHEALTRLRIDEGLGCGALKEIPMPVTVTRFERTRLREVPEMTQAGQRVHAVPRAIGNGEECRQGLLL